MGLVAAQGAGWVEAVIAVPLAHAQLMFGAFGQALVGQFQFAHIHIVLFQAFHA